MKKLASLLGVFSLLVGMIGLVAAQDFDVDWGTDVECRNGDEIESGVEMTIIQQRSGNQYTITAVGIDGFDPILAVALADELDDALCSDNERSASYYEADLPTTGEVESSRDTAQVVFNLTSRNAFENVSIVVGSEDGDSGEFVLIVEGMYAGGSSDGAGDPFSLYISPALVTSEVTPTAYMISVTQGLDSFLSVINADYEILQDTEGEDIYCDDAGNRRLCWGEHDDLSGSFVSRTQDRTVGGWEYDSMLSFPITEESVGYYINYVMAGNNSVGDYVAVFHLGWGEE